MHKLFFPKVLILAITFGAILGGKLYAQTPPSVLTFSPPRYSTENGPSVAITAQFDSPVNGGTATADNFVVYGEQSGLHSGTLNYNPANSTIAFNSSTPFQTGERVTVILTSGITGSNGAPLAGFQWSFYIRSAAATSIFQLDSTYTTSNGPHAVGVGQLNANTALDIAIPHTRTTHQTTIWNNDGSGNFAQTDAVTVGSTPRSLTIADIDRDGDMDIAVASEGTNSVSVLTNNGSGDFTATATLPVGLAPNNVAAGDLNSDGLLDLVIANTNSNSISLLINNGGGTFASQVPVLLNGSPQASIIADFNNDGFADIAVTDTTSANDAVALLLNDGTGNFATPVDFPVGNHPRAIAGSDFDSDGRIDLVVSNRDDNTVSVLFNTGGGFSLPNNYNVGTDPVAITAGDWNGDGNVDFAVSNRLSGDLYVFLNNGAGSFPSSDTYPLGAEPRGLNAGDFNGDGVVDLAATNFSSNTLQVLFNNFGAGQNDPPAAPVLTSPADRAFINPNTTPIQLSWNVPVDADGNPLHFLIEIAASANFANPVVTFDSRDNVTGFNPAPPVAQGAGSVTFSITASLSDGLYFWRVTARDALALGAPSSSRRFTVDTAAPIIDRVVITDPAFTDILGNKWYNPNPGATPSINFGAQYDEARPLRAEFNLGAPFGGTQTQQNIPSGQDQLALTIVTFGGAADGSYPLSVTIFDSTANPAASNTTIRLDRTAPTSARANSPASSAQAGFTVSWTTGNDGTGSGLSGRFTVRVQTDGGAWQDWLTNFQGTSSTFTGEDGHSYAFEAAAHDNVGNIEAFANTAETTTVVDFNANDVTAPGPPTNLRAAGSDPSPWQIAPQFQIQWQPPSDPSGILRALYKLGSAPSANFDTTASVRSGNSVTVTATQEDGQNFHIWFQDQRGNVDFHNRDTVQLRYDKTAATVASIDFLNPDFEPNWFSQALTSEANVEITYSERHLRRIQMQSPSLSIDRDVTNVPSGVGVSRQFTINIENKTDGSHKLTFTLTDSAGNLKVDSTRIALDSVPPSGTLANSPDTSGNTSFLVTWGSTGSDGGGSGLSGVYDVRVQEDGGPWQTWKTNFAGASDNFTGENNKKYGFEAVAYDNVGNREEFDDVAESVTFVDPTFQDITAPSIVHTPPSQVDQGQGVTLTAQISDNNQVAQVLLFFKASGDVGFQSQPMNNTTGSNYEFTLSATQISATGVNYFISATDGTNFSFHPPTDAEITPNNISVLITGAGNQGLAKGTPQPAGNNEAAYRMVSVPLNLQNETPQSVLEDDLGAYDPQVWRLFQYNAASDQYTEYPSPSVGAFTPGKAFWLIVRDPNLSIDSGIGATVATNQPFNINLVAGWNDIALPFPFAVDAADIQVTQGNASTVIGPYTFQSQWLIPTQVTTLQPWEGYSYYSAASATLSILPIASASQSSSTLASDTAPLRGKTAFESEWNIAIGATSGGLRDGANFLGVSQQALLDRDAMDYLEPPYIANHVSVIFPHPDWSGIRGAFTTDFRPPFKDGQVWHFEVVSTLGSQPITLRFANLESLPLELEAILLDKQSLKQLNIRQIPDYIFALQQNESVREFDLVIGTREYIENSETLNNPTPQSFFLSQNYPNPFNAGTSLSYQVSEPAQVNIKVLNILGQHVRTLVSQQQPAGVYRINWDGAADSGVAIGSGIYLIQMEAGRFRQIRKVVLVR